MSQFASRRGAIALFASAGLLAALAPTMAVAAPVTFTVPLTGAEQSPPVTTSGSGAAEITYDPATRVVTWSVQYSGLSGPATMAHFHGPAAAGANAPVTIWMVKKGEAVANPFRGEATLSATQAEQFSAGQWYINVHTKQNPDGEIRGQVAPPKS